MNKERNKDGTFAAGNSGRPKGSRNKYTQKMLDTAMSHLEERNFNPMDEILKLYRTTKDEQLKARILMDYLKINNNPALITTDEEGKSEYMELSNDELAQRVKELTSK
ncbi:hypothetical protein AB4259_02715 [Vibrio amylolyticus]|uniref:hypothetical protein n=1 Tax=Vibrio amylolyticus TaxID=2847292 RepID=UPI00354F3A7E